MIEFFRHLF